MLKIQESGDNLLLSFSGSKKQFNEYINTIMKIKEKTFDFENKCWTTSKRNLSDIKRLFKDYEYLEEIREIKIINSELKDIGSTLKLSPYEYQKEAIKYGLDHLNALLTLPCGSGKTIIGIGTYVEAKKAGIVNGTGLIVVKASLKQQWKKEVSKFSDLNANILQTDSAINTNINNKIKAREKKLKTLISDHKIESEILELQEEKIINFNKQFEGYDLLIANYEALKDDNIREKLLNMNIEYIFADELHYAANHTSGRSKALYELNNAKMKIGATATPIMKDPLNLFGIFNFIDQNIFENYNKFSKLYIKWAGRGRIAGIKNKDHMIKKIHGNMIVKTKQEVSSQLPSTVINELTIDMTPEQYGIYNKIKNELEELSAKEFALTQSGAKEGHEELEKISAMISALHTFAQELCDAPELLMLSDSDLSKNYVPSNLYSPKLELLIDSISEIIDSGEKVAIFSKYERMQNIITKAINKAKLPTKIAYVNGSISGQKRYEEVYEKFNTNDEYKVLLMSDAGAEGINLSSCKYLIEYELAQSYTIQTQRQGRVERADSIHDTVFVYQMLCNNSYDDEIAKKVVEKKQNYDNELIKRKGTS